MVASSVASAGVYRVDRGFAMVLEERMRYGITFDGRAPVSEALPLAQAAEAHGLDCAWVGEHLGHRDALVYAATLLERTQRLAIGVGAISPYYRHPAQIAMGVATLRETACGVWPVRSATASRWALPPRRGMSSTPSRARGRRPRRPVVIRTRSTSRATSSPRSPPPTATRWPGSSGRSP